MDAYVTSILSLIALNVMLALGLNIINGFCGQISLGHAAFYGAGAYAAAKLAFDLPSIAVLPIATVIAGVFGVLVGLASLRLRHDFLAVTTLGVGFVFVGVVRKQKWSGGELGLTGIPDSGLSAQNEALFVLGCALVVVCFCLYLKRSWMGFAFASIAKDEDAARTLGVNVPAFKLAAFAIGTTIAGFAGGCYAYYSKAVLPDSFSFLQSIAILTAVVIGGMGSVIGVTVASVLLTLLPEWFRFISDYRLLVYGGILVGVMFFSPGGLAGLFRKLTHRELP